MGLSKKKKTKLLFNNSDLKSQLCAFTDKMDMRLWKKQLKLLLLHRVQSILQEPTQKVIEIINTMYRIKGKLCPKSISQFWEK